jgi:hypothetical protein
VPAVLAVTFTVIVQLPPAGTVPPVRLIPTSPMPSAPAPVSVSVPPQVFALVESRQCHGTGRHGERVDEKVAR